MFIGFGYLGAVSHVTGFFSFIDSPSMMEVVSGLDSWMSQRELLTRTSYQPIIWRKNDDEGNELQSAAATEPLEEPPDCSPARADRYIHCNRSVMHPYFASMQYKSPAMFLINSLPAEYTGIVQ